MCQSLTTQNPKVSLFMLSSGWPTQTPACFRAEAVERPAASVATAAAAAPALECVCGVTTAVRGGGYPEGWGWWLHQTSPSWSAVKRTTRGLGIQVKG